MKRTILLLLLTCLLVGSLSLIKNTRANHLTVPVPQVNWSPNSSHTGLLAAPSRDTEQTAALIMDIDKNGRNDIVIGVRGSQGPSLVWYRLEANQWQRYIIDADPLQIEAGGAYHDIDGDGDLDIVMGGDNQSNQVWWWENPYPNFQNPWQRRLIKNGGNDIHHDQIFGDFDNDGKVELVFWNQASWNPSNNQARIYIANIPANPKTSGTWSTASIYSGFGEGLAKADIDGDGVEDLLAAGRWFKHQSGNTFTPHVIDNSLKDGRIAAADLTGNGKMEVVMVRGDDIGPLRWYSCNGDPTKSSCWKSHTLLPDDVHHGHSLQIADVNADGHEDIFVAEMRLDGDNHDALMWLFYGHGDGTFTTAVIGHGTGNHESKIGDLNGDGRLDILVKPYNWNTPRLDIWLNGGNGRLSSWNRHVIDNDRPERAIFIDAADMNGDTLPDIVTGGWWYPNPGSAAAAWPRQTIGAPLHNMATIHDFDGNGTLDILGTQGVGSRANNSFAWAQNDGSGNFTIRQNIQNGNGNFLQGITVGRFTASQLEVALSWNNGTGGSQMLTVPPNPANGTWTWRKFSDTSQGEGLDHADIDQDGDLDIMLGNIWLRNNGGSWQPFTLHTPSTGQPDRVHLVDMDKDGDLDVVVGYGHDENGKLAWYERPSDPTQLWAEHLLANLVNPQSVDVADMDNDGDLDVIVGEHNLGNPDASQLIIYENQDGRGQQWQPHLVHQGDEHHDGAKAVDIDNDGDLDIVSIGWTHNRVLVYENAASDLVYIVPRALLPLVQRP